jgi:DNA-directed RNA polymerase, subunit H (EC 2.7.7.6)
LNFISTYTIGKLYFTIKLVQFSPGSVIYFMPSSRRKQFDPITHELVPKHEVLPLEEAVKVLRELGIHPQKLPWIKASDPIVQQLKAKPGDIIKIERISPLGTKVVTYRFVVVG